MNRTLQLTNIAGFILVIIINYLATSLPINGKSTGELSDQYPNLFVPAGITFSIWGIIYLALLAFTIYQAKGLFDKDKQAPEAVGKIGWWFVLSCLANATWLFAWHYEQVLLSLVIMLCFLGVLIRIYTLLDIGKKKPDARERYFVHLPFSIYLGWISIATIANTTTWLVTTGWQRFGAGEAFWAMAMILIGAGLALFVVLTRRDFAYPAVVIWAFAGIIIKQNQLGLDVSSNIILVAGLSIAIIAVGMVVRALRG